MLHCFVQPVNYVVCAYIPVLVSRDVILLGDTKNRTFLLGVIFFFAIFANSSANKNGEK